MILAFPYHDPSGKYNQVFLGQLETLRSLFEMICISVTSQTSKDNANFVQHLKEHGCSVFHNAPTTSFGDHSREALKLALEHTQASQSIFFGFIDRILFILETNWKTHFIHDLEIYKASNCMIFERSQTAWTSHPSNYRGIEQMASRMFELICGKFIELSPGAFILSYLTAKKILSQSTTMSYAVWGEWVLLAMKNNIPITTQKVDWLTWEDPYWEHVEPEKLKQSRELSQKETIKRIRWNVTVMEMITEERFRGL
ncbi:MAG: hypothetical protein ACFFBD_24805 [Candidatus Hodarchaeota archaeon]